MFDVSSYKINALASHSRPYIICPQPIAYCFLPTTSAITKHQAYTNALLLAFPTLLNVQDIVFAL